MNFSLSRCALPVLVIFTSAASGFAQCNPPKSPGVIICAPTPGSTAVYPANVDIAATPASGASITNFVLYDNNTKVIESSNGQRQRSVVNGSTYNGNHNFVVNAWDTDDNFYRAKAYSQGDRRWLPSLLGTENSGHQFLRSTLKCHLWLPFYAELQRIRETVETLAEDQIRRSNPLVTLLYARYYRGSVGGHNQIAETAVIESLLSAIGYTLSNSAIRMGHPAGFSNSLGPRVCCSDMAAAEDGGATIYAPTIS